MKLTKKEERKVRECRACLPLVYSEKAIESFGDKLVVRELIQIAAINDHAAKQSRQTAKHWLEHFNSQEVHERFEKLAKEQEKRRDWYQGLASKVAMACDMHQTKDHESCSDSAGDNSRRVHDTGSRRERATP